MDPNIAHQVFKRLEDLSHSDDYAPLDRLAVVFAALQVIPRGKRAKGVPGLITGETVEGNPSVTEALRVARFALDPHSDLPGVDKSWKEEKRSG